MEDREQIMSDNKFIKFEEDNEYIEALEKGLEGFKSGDISKNEFLEKYINRQTTRESMSLEEYKNLPLFDHDQQNEDVKQLEGVLTTKNLKITLGPYKLLDKIPSDRGDGTGVGSIIVGRLLKHEEIPTVSFEFKMIDVIL